jgi:hypothetical protein
VTRVTRTTEHLDARRRMRDALLVAALTPHIRDYLLVYDPKALKQIVDSLAGEFLSADQRAQLNQLMEIAQ